MRIAKPVSRLRLSFPDPSVRCPGGEAAQHSPTRCTFQGSSPPLHQPGAGPAARRCPRSAPASLPPARAYANARCAHWTANCACTQQLAALKLKIPFKKISYRISRTMFFFYFEARTEGTGGARPPAAAAGARWGCAPRSALARAAGGGAGAGAGSLRVPPSRRSPPPPLSRGLLLTAPPGSL